VRLLIEPLFPTVLQKNVVYIRLNNGRSFGIFLCPEPQVVQGRLQEIHAGLLRRRCHGERPRVAQVPVRHHERS